jgi:hypothetical protein
MRPTTGDIGLRRVLFDLVSAGDRLDYARLKMLMERYPQYREDLRELAVAWLLEDPPDVPPEMSEEQMETLVQVGLKRLDELSTDRVTTMSGGRDVSEREKSGAPELADPASAGGGRRVGTGLGVWAGLAVSASPGGHWNRLLAPAALTLAVSVALVLIGFHGGSFALLHAEADPATAIVDKLSVSVHDAWHSLVSLIRHESGPRRWPARQSSDSGLQLQAAAGGTPPSETRAKVLDETATPSVASMPAAGTMAAATSQWASPGNDFWRARWQLVNMRAPEIGTYAVIVNSPGRSLERAIRALDQVCASFPELEIALWRTEDRDDDAPLPTATPAPNKTYALVIGSGLPLEQATAIINFIKVAVPDAYSLQQLQDAEMIYTCDNKPTRSVNIIKPKLRQIPPPRVTTASLDTR